METFWQNNSCNPFGDRSTPCEVGNMISYAVNVSAAAEIAATIHFARTHNVRFVVRNTGHDFNGRSTGAGGLAVWTHHLKSLEIIQNIEMKGDPDKGEQSYQGPALKMGSGVQGVEAEHFAADAGLVVVGGWCPSVGIAGGFTQGGGHSPLGSQFGMGADQTLEFQVVTANGSVVTASPQENSDLYWALSGGGPGTYGIVTSVTVRAYPNMPVGGAFVSITNDLSLPNASTVLENYWATIQTWHTLLPNLTSTGIGATFSYNNSLFYLIPLTAYNKTSKDVRAALKPWIDQMDTLGVNYSASFTDFPSYYSHWTTFALPGPVGAYWQGTSRLVPTDIFDDPTSLEKFIGVQRKLADQGVYAGATAVAPRKLTGFANAVLPAWRNTVSLFGLLTDWSDDPTRWEEMQEMQHYVDQELRPLLKSVTGGTAGDGNWARGSYLNEASGDDPAWKQEFFGENLQRLEEVKQRWDPDGLFWGLRLVGSEAREIRGQPTGIGNGRLCKAEK
ncbi:hypothetical protein JX265_001067 [Neoarthrinium moseri]|uniref:FAD-binding PCMH-type domain-containing protein n=1 Tax=Neoarthrinium moseri TaxID=1658444 RepID=A0A9Q0AU73_9PEZI|nr:uncharacterized protein JN550_004661 [Neoarthrinium moseri]KAI1871216.1 hypothetical protein JN550_004661 [Neoarthrinium moseri]KAI1880827.1 hypothetical protein JX265_001067 [Neoarthrinium moseri]